MNHGFEQAHCSLCVPAKAKRYGWLAMFVLATLSPLVANALPFTPCMHCPLQKYEPNSAFIDVR